MGSAVFYIPADRIESDLFPVTGSELGFILYQSLSLSGLWNQVYQIYQNTYGIAQYPKAKILLEIKAPKLFRLPWEKIFESTPLSFLGTVFVLVRYLSKEREKAFSPLTLPIDILIAADATKPTLANLPTDQPPEGPLRYFRCTKATGVSSDYVKNIMQSVRFDIVHLTGKAEFTKTGSHFIPGTGPSAITPKEIQDYLNLSGTRFLILHCVDDHMGPFLHFAHQLFHENGPVILVLNQSADAMQKALNDIYFEIVHDRPLDEIFQNLQELPLNASLFLVPGGTEVLRISLLAASLFARYQSHKQYVGQVLPSLFQQMNRMYEQGKLEKARSLERHLGSLEQFVAASQIEGIPEEHFLDFSHETGGMEPLKKITQINTDIENLLKEVEPEVSRVVNCWFKSGNEIIDRQESLEPDANYSYEVQIGAPHKKSIVQKPAAFPDKELAPFFPENGLPLRVELFSADFSIPVSSATLVLPRPPDESDTVTFSVVTPASPGVARMRVCIYFEQNLVQSLLVRSIIGSPVDTEAGFRGNSAEVDFSLSNTLTNLERLPPRMLNIALNDNGSGTHSFYILGSFLKRQFDFGEGEISSYTKETRNALQDICSERDKNGKPVKYRFDLHNKGNEKNFITEIKTLAELGYQLYAEIIINHSDKVFTDQLALLLHNPASVIQVSSTRSAKFVFPWALVYDKPLVQGDYEVCPQFLSDIRNPAIIGLASQTCIANGCPHMDRTDIICPSGFWGYKHIIEQPLSVGAERIGTVEVPLEIKAPGQSSVMMGVSRTLSDVETHLKELQQLGNIGVQMLESKREIGIGMNRKDFQVIYFYCHGGRSGQKTWLGVGSKAKKEMIVPPDLLAWKINWPKEHPFVFVNGCHTADLSPDDFVHFNNAFANCEAAGVMGTEITINETLARHFANGFLERFLKGTNVGTAVREQRLAMLKNYNLLGLAYTPYCSADLKITYT